MTLRSDEGSAGTRAAGSIEYDAVTFPRSTNGTLVCGSQRYFGLASPCDAIRAAVTARCRVSQLRR